ncbi:hypothetical protein N8597_00965 [Akkermansiaceae bacterium]|nr:hypothetical protein [Akkermansiaceae bacterium]MDB4416704.1 hypothetical protein [bacterium]MDB4259262.1 hypothetical protein [Akkermansiaceae bacterium]MDB4373942.1 hypothetical protein [Akkermansiaceae bacterium]MDB4381764.1 hypothetical protein [Akkermansiaceae bacterium]
MWEVSSVATAKINSEGKAILKDGQTFFETGPGTVWGDDTPRLHHPLFYEVSGASDPPSKWPFLFGGLALAILVWIFWKRSSFKRKQLSESAHPST